MKIIYITLVAYVLCFTSVSAQTKAGALMLGGYTAYAEKCQSFTREGAELKNLLVSRYIQTNSNLAENIESGFKRMVRDGCEKTRKALKSLERQDPSTRDFHQSLFGGIR